jgi:hypothetical protein
VRRRLVRGGGGKKDRVSGGWIDRVSDDSGWIGRMDTGELIGLKEKFVGNHK